MTITMVESGPALRQQPGPWPTPGRGADVRKRTPFAERFWAKVDVRGSGECWPWTAAISDRGYGVIGSGGRRGVSVYAHRAAFELLVGPIPVGLEIDHTCHSDDTSCAGGTACPHRRCVNPNHLEPVTGRTNQRRGRTLAAKNLAKTHCPRGHPYDEANTLHVKWRGRVMRQCRACRRERQRREVTR